MTWDRKPKNIKIKLKPLTEENKKILEEWKKAQQELKEKRNTNESTN